MKRHVVCGFSQQNEYRLQYTEKTRVCVNVKFCDKLAVWVKEYSFSQDIISQNCKVTTRKFNDIHVACMGMSLIRIV